MAKGLQIDNSSPRNLLLNGQQIVSGGSSNRAGLYSIGNKLYLDGKEITEDASQIGLRVVGNALYFGETLIAESGGGDEPVVETTLWIPPTQAASSRTPYSYTELIALYDELMNNSSYPGTITKHQYSELGYGDYPLYHYEFTPTNYTKTFYIESCIHGNEHDAPQALYRIMDIICNHASESAYSRLAELRDNVRLIIIPVVSPWGYDNNSMNVPYTDWNGEEKSGTSAMNMNRNADIIHQYAIPQGGTGGNYPWQRSEVRHIKSVVESIGVQNIDYMVDFHDGESVDQHIWINYNMDGANGAMVRQLVNDLLAYEEAYYPQYKDDELGWVIDYCCDASGYASGSQAAWYNTTLGALGSVCEYMGGYFGYTFDAEQMTRSLRIRANLLIYAYEMLDTKGWQIDEAEDAQYFEFNYPIAMTRQGLRKDGVDTTYSNTVTTIAQVYERWDALVSAYPDYVSKSAELGTNYSGTSIYSYTLGSGSKKVLFIGGCMRWGAAHKETEFGIYVLAEYLCNDYMVNQSRFLQTLKNDYTIVVLPCIDILAGGNSTDIRQLGLNSYALSTTQKWEISDSKCQATSYGDGCNDVTIFKAWIAAHSDAIALISGGEDTSGYAFERPTYETEYMTQIILPMNQAQPSWLTDYCTWLVDSRGEDTPDIEATTGMTSGDYAYDNYGIPTYYINLQVSNMWEERSQYAQEGDSAEKYMYRNYETGRRIADIANFFLMAGGDIVPDGVELYDYLEQRDSVAYINTGVTANDNTKIEFSAHTTCVGSFYFTGTRIGGISGNIIFALTGQQATKNCIYKVGDTQEMLNVTRDSSGQSINGWLQTNGDLTFSYYLNFANTEYSNSNIDYSSYPLSDNTANIYIFSNGANIISGTNKLYGYKIYQSGTLVRDFRPCTYNGEAGMWDMVNGVFYGNANSRGAFTVGNE